MTSKPIVEVLPDPEALAEHAAHWLLDLATAKQGLFSVSLSALGFAALSGSRTVQAINYWPVLAAPLGLLCLIFGSAILAVNCGLTAIRGFQLRNG